eukprot:TRINITY_DN1775_c0_g1_i5.p1 TRINITY_DN1775_c0_g1~~TRINITY_DN1775_c0_g1_i5.p1  ORF type:complete len:373 (+),score=69.37 TRINITY_DN1775_c0_g1_i5:842-1960(+)
MENVSLELGESHALIEILQTALRHNGTYKGAITSRYDKDLSESLQGMVGSVSVIPLTVEVLKVVLDAVEDSLPAPSEPQENDVVTLGLEGRQCINILNRIVQASIKKDEPKKKSGRLASLSNDDAITLYRELYFSSGNKHWVYISQLYIPQSSPMTPMTLVLICKDMKGTQVEQDLLRAAEKAIKESLTHTYAEYLLSVESTYSMISYIHQLPGLVHFILVERTEQRVHAPNIVSLFGPDSPLLKNKEISKNAVKLLKNKIWDLCYQSQEFLARGYFTTIMMTGEFQYYYCLWFDSSGPKIPKITFPFNWNPKQPLNYKFYNLIQNNMVKSYGPVQCYELYALYLNFLPVKMVENHSQQLASKLLGKSVRWH